MKVEVRNLVVICCLSATAVGRAACDRRSSSPNNHVAAWECLGLCRPWLSRHQIRHNAGPPAAPAPPRLPRTDVADRTENGPARAVSPPSAGVEDLRRWL